MDNYFSSQRNPKISWWLASVLILVAFLAGLFLGGNAYLQKGKAIIKGVDPKTATSTAGTLKNANGEIPEYLTKDVDFNLFWEVWNLVRNKYYDQNIPETQLFYGSLAGIVASLGDSYSVFMTAQDTNNFEEELKGNFEGIGAEIGIRNNVLTVISPLPDTPALRAGLRAGDVILKINDQDTSGMSLDKAISLIRGQSGTAVTLEIYREGLKEAKKIKITREPITVKSVAWEFKDEVVYIKIRQFNDDTTPLFNDAILDILRQSRVRGIILDLRYNPGGYLQAAIDMAGEWIDCETVVVEKLRDGSEIKHQANRPARLADFKTVVLVNGGSASGSEIVAGALQDFKKATLIGTKTFGKGSVQDLTTLSDGSSIKLTIAKWFTPQGRSIQEQGIEPDLKVDISEEDFNKNKDPQLDRARELLK